MPLGERRLTGGKLLTWAFLVYRSAAIGAWWAVGAIARAIRIAPVLHRGSARQVDLTCSVPGMGLPATVHRVSLNVSSLHVRTEDQAAVHRLVERPALISPAAGGWVSIYSQDEFETPVAADVLSAELHAPVVHFGCFESSIATAELSSEGAWLTQLTSGEPPLIEEFYGALPSDPVVSENEFVTVWFDAAKWSAALGDITSDRLSASAAVAPDDPFPEAAVISVLELVGISAESLQSWYWSFDSPGARDGFVHS